MSPSKAAIYNSAESETIKRGLCTPGTRKPQIDLLLEWARTPDSGKTCWMNGMAGTGKTTIAYTVCSQLERDCQLGASFFCSRTISACRQVKYIIPTIAYQLARFSLPFQYALSKALELDPDAQDRALGVQYQKLIVEPLAEVRSSLPEDFIVVIDALDECENEDSVSQILDQLLSSTDTSLIRFLISSRPEKQIAHKMAGRLNGHEDTRLVLHDLDRSTVKADIKAYMRAELKEVPLTDAQWPLVVDCCGELFIYASTVCRYIKNAHETMSLKEAVHTVATRESNHGHEKTIDDLYRTLLGTAFGSSGVNDQDKKRMNDILQTVVCAMEPMSVNSIASLLRLDSGDRRAEMWCIEQKVNEDLILLVRDASQFVSVYANHPVSQSTPHIYVSMLAFWPPSRPISGAYMSRTSGLARPTGTAMDRRQLALIATWKFSNFGVNSMGLKADGTRLVAPSENGIEVYDTATGESVVSLTDNCAKKVYYVAISGDGTRVAFSQYDGAPYVWDIRNGGTVTQLLADSISEVTSIAISYDGTRVACGLKNGEVYIQALDQAASSIGPLQMHTGRVWSVAFSPNGLHLASGSFDPTIQVWDVRTGQPVGESFGNDMSQVLSLSYSNDGSRIASGFADKTVRVWDPQKGQSVLGPLVGHSDGVSCVAFSSNHALIASGSWDYTILVYNAHTGHTVLGPLRGHTGTVSSVIFSPDATRLFSCSDDRTVRIWNVKDLGGPAISSTAPALSVATFAVRYSHSGLRVVSGSHDGSVHVWDVRTGKLVRGPLRGHKSVVSCVDYSPDDQRIASGSWDNTLRIWDASTGEDTHGPMNGHSRPVNCVRFSADGSLVVSGSNDGTVRTWDVSTGQQTKQLFAGYSEILSVGVSPVGSQVVCGSLDGLIRLLDIHTGDTLVGTIQGHTLQVSSVEFSPDGKRLVSGSHDNTARIWDAETGKQLVVCGGYDDSYKGFLNCVALSPNGLHVASCSYGDTLHIWDGQSGKLIIGPLRGHTSIVLCVQFSPDGSHLVSCSHDATIRFWDVSCIGSRLQTNNTIKSDDEALNCPKSHTGPDWWLLDEEGWVTDSGGRHLIWVPPDLRSCLVFPPTSIIVADQGYYQLDTDGWKIGNKWTECYRA
ncbi:Vegetative incompatibility protein HET-E-1 [Rhizoctonia solani AG-1 IB]|uniref:Vegetative incompatibility protein HET-E-1 n=1 Tax=Thanatephorus cucumeris (strain AG1-IB / isolate 7/3/14) TaxID=1108050 RepID=M5C9K0_THACB|nr:Vegetative incompatibility protein HET-E-1 [Rhizoctonia solani AG-1 IB]